MKRILILLACVLLFSCGEQTPEKPDFILGNWTRLNDAEGKTTYEIWNSDFTGIGFTMQNKDTVFKEILSIVELDGKLVYKVEGVNEEHTLFTFTQQSKNSFVCENPDNEFPKVIEYVLEDDQLNAVISAGKDSIEFIFEKDN